MCVCPVRMWFVTFLGVEVTLKDVGVPFNCNGLTFQSVECLIRVWEGPNRI